MVWSYHNKLIADRYPYKGLVYHNKLIAERYPYNGLVYHNNTSSYPPSQTVRINLFVQ